MEAIKLILKAYELRPNPKYASTLASYIREKKDPERAQLTSNTYYDWLLDRAYLLVPAQAYVGKFLGTFKEYPPRQKAATFSLDKVMEELQSAGGSK